jgi:hypothetical protein
MRTRLKEKNCLSELEARFHPSKPKSRWDFAQEISNINCIEEDNVIDPSILYNTRRGLDAR